MAFLKVAHASAGIWRLVDGSEERVEVEEESKGLVREGVRSAFRWTERESSTVARESRRKSDKTALVYQNTHTGCGKDLPRTAVVSKQNCGVNVG